MPVAYENSRPVPIRPPLRARATHSLPLLASKVFDTPWLIHPSKAAIIMRSEIGRRILAGVDIQDLPSDALDALLYGGSVFGDRLDLSSGRDRRNYQVTESGIAIIPVQGTLMKKAGGLWGLSGCSSYEGIAEDVAMAMADSSVRALALDIDSPGGQTNGCFELCDYLSSLRGQGKPIHGTANDLAASAAYAILSCCEKAYVTMTGAVGSIGVYSMHVDQSKADQKAGLDYTFTHAGAKKVDGNPHEPLSKTARQDAQTEVDRQYGLFVQTVAKNRKVSASKVIATEAGVYFAGGAVPMLADEVGTLDDCIFDLEEQIGARSSSAARSTSYSKAVDMGKRSAAKTDTISSELGEQTMADTNVLILTAEETASILAARAATATTTTAAKPAPKKGDADYVAGDPASDGDEDDAKPATEDDKMKKGSKGEKAEVVGNTATITLPNENTSGGITTSGTITVPAVPAAAAPAKTETQTPKKAEVISMPAPAAEDTNRQIIELCTIAGQRAKAVDFIDQKKTLTEVRELLLAERAALSDSTAPNATMRPGSSSAIESIEQQVTALVAASGGKLSRSKAYVRVVASNPDIYEQYCHEHDTNIVNKKFTPAYAAVLSRIPAARGISTSAELLRLSKEGSERQGQHQ